MGFRQGRSDLPDLEVQGVISTDKDESKVAIGGHTDPQATLDISGSFRATGNAVISGSLTQVGNITIGGDIILDDGGSLKEAGGTAAITFDGSGHVTKIGQDTHTSGQFLKFDGSKFVLDAASGGGEGAVSSVANGSDNRVATFSSSDALNGEANFTYDGTDLAVTCDTATFTSANANDPLMIVKNTANDATGPILRLENDRGSNNGADGDDCGIIEFVGTDAGSTQTTFAKILAEVSEADNTDEAGKLSLMVAESDGTTTTLTAGLVLEGEHATDGEVDVTIGAGMTSTTTIVGTSLFGGNATFGADDTGVDVRIFSATASEGVLYDASEDELALLLTTKLKFHDVGGGEEIFASANGHLEINAGTTLDATAPTVDINASTAVTIDTPGITVTDTTASSATEGGSIRLVSNDGALMGNGHRLGVIEFAGAEDGSNTITVGARIESLCDAAWSGTENGASLLFYTTDGNAAQSQVLKLDSNKVANFAGSIWQSTDGSGLMFGANAEVTLTHVHDTGLLLSDASGIGTTKLMFGDAACFIQQQADGELGIDADSVINVTAPTVDIDASTAVTIDGPAVTLADSAAGKPVLTLKTTHTTTASSGELQFLKDAADTEDGEVLGQITFYGEDEGNNNTAFAKIVASISESDEGDEAGKLELFVAESDSTTTALTAGLTLEGEHATDGEIDVTIGAGTGSTTTIAGSLDVTHNVHYDSSPADESSSGMTATFTAGEDLVRGEVVYFKPGDSKMWKAVATAAATSRCVAMAAEDISADAAGKFLLKGFLTDNGSFPSYTAGGVLYTPEAETSSENVPEQAAPDTDGDFVQIIGWAVTANTVYFCPDSTVIEVA
jgi:hypothetical protein